MRIENLASPGPINNSCYLRREAARAISYHESQADRRGSPADGATELAAFFEDCRSNVPGASPYGGLADNQAVVSDGDVVNVGGTDYTVAVSGNTITGFTAV